VIVRSDATSASPRDDVPGKRNRARSSSTRLCAVGDSAIGLASPTPAVTRSTPQLHPEAVVARSPIVRKQAREFMCASLKAPETQPAPDPAIPETTPSQRPPIEGQPHKTPLSAYPAPPASPTAQELAQFAFLQELSESAADVQLSALAFDAHALMALASYAPPGQTQLR
jgi:hypothetical protein